MIGKRSRTNAMVNQKLGSLSAETHGEMEAQLFCPAEPVGKL
jgi:hypothetical protein